MAAWRSLTWRPKMREGTPVLRRTTGERPTARALWWSQASCSQSQTKLKTSSPRLPLMLLGRWSLLWRIPMLAGNQSRLSQFYQRGPTSKCQLMLNNGPQSKVTGYRLLLDIHSFPQGHIHEGVALDPLCRDRGLGLAALWEENTNSWFKISQVIRENERL